MRRKGMHMTKINRLYPKSYPSGPNFGINAFIPEELCEGGGGGGAYRTRNTVCA